MVVVIYLDGLEVPSTSMKRSRTERFTTASKIITKSAKKSSDGIVSQHCSKTSTAKPSATADTVNKMKKIKESSERHATERKSRIQAIITIPL